jgi:hypothetical protein
VSYEVTLKERKVEDLRSLQKFDRVDEKPFQAVAALSNCWNAPTRCWRGRLCAKCRPSGWPKRGEACIRCASSTGRFSDKNPFLWALPYLATAASNNRKPRSADNDSVKLEKVVAEIISAILDRYRELRDATCEAAFFEVYGNMLSLHMADEREEIRRRPQVRPALASSRARSSGHDRRGQRHRGLARIAMLICKAGQASAGCRRCSARARFLSPEGDIAHLSEDERRRCCRKKPSSSSSNPSAPNARCPSCCALRPNAVTRWRC